MKAGLRFLCFIALATHLAMCQQGGRAPANVPPASSPYGSPANIAELAKKAQAARESDQIEEAVRLYKRLVQLKPASTEYWWYLGMLYYESDDYANGQTAFRRVTTGKPEMALGWAMLGLCEFETKDYGRSLAHLAKADDLKIPRQEQFYDVAKYHLALLLVRAEKFEDAVKVITEFAKEGKDGQQFVEAMGLAGLRKPLLPQELPPTERELVLDVGHAMCDSAARRATELDRDIQELVSKYPSTPQIHFLAGSMLLTSDPDRALAEWKAELVVSPTHPQALVSVAQEYLKRGEYDNALPFAEKAVTANPSYFIGHALLGQVLVEGKLDATRGVHELETAVRLAPKQPQVHFALGNAYVRVGRKADAEKELAEFLRLRGQN